MRYEYQRFTCVSRVNSPTKRLFPWRKVIFAAVIILGLCALHSLDLPECSGPVQPSYCAD